MATKNKVHWTQTPEGRKRLSEQAKAAHRRPPRATWSPERKAKFRATIAAKKKAGKVAQEFPLDIFPPKKEVRAKVGKKAVSTDNKVELALAFIQAVQNILK